MSMRAAFVGMGLVGVSLVLCGCEGPLCPEGKRLAETGKAREAILAYKQCRSMEKSPNRIAEINQRIAALAPGIVRPVTEKWERQPPGTIPQYDQAIAELEDVQPFDEPGTPWKIAEKVASYKAARQKVDGEVKKLLEQAFQRRQARQWKEAAAAVAAALAKHPGRLDAMDVQRQMLAERDESYRSQVTALCDAERWKEAADLLERYRTEEPPPLPAVTQALTQRVEKTKGDVIARTVRRGIVDKRYFEAYNRLVETQAPGCADLLEIIKKDGYKYYAGVAKEMLNEARQFHAYAAAVKARDLPKPPRTAAEDPENLTFELQRQCADLVDASIQDKICIAAFDSPQAEAAIGKEFADRLVNEFHQLLPYGLHLDDRRKVEYAIAGNREKLREGLQLVGANWAIQGSLSVNVVRDHQERDRTKWVPVKKTITNPQYEADIMSLEKRYGKNPAKWPQQPARTITEELTEQVTYKAGAERMEGEILLSANLYSAAEGFITQSQSFRVAKDVNDTFSDGVEQAGIKADPLQMPSQLTFRQELEQQMRKQVTTWILGNFGPRQQKLCEQAQYHVDRREWDQAVRAATQGYYYCLRDNVPRDDKWFIRLRQLALFDLTESAPGAAPAKP